MTAIQAVKFVFQPLVSSFRPFHTSEVIRGHEVKRGHTSKSPIWRCSTCFWVLLSCRARKPTLKHSLFERNRPKIQKTVMCTYGWLTMVVIMLVLELWGWNLVNIFIGHESIWYWKNQKTSKNLPKSKFWKFRKFEISRQQFCEERNSKSFGVSHLHVFPKLTFGFVGWTRTSLLTLWRHSDLTWP